MKAIICVIRFFLIVITVCFVIGWAVSSDNINHTDMVNSIREAIFVQKTIKNIDSTTRTEYRLFISCSDSNKDSQVEIKDADFLEKNNALDEIVNQIHRQSKGDLCTVDFIKKEPTAYYLAGL